MVEKIRKILKFLKSADNFLITAHMNADGDAYASVLAMAYLLDQWQKKYRVIIHDEQVESKYQYLWGFDKIRTYNSAGKQSFDAAVVLDVPSLSRMGDPAKLLPRKDFCVKIDHHPVEDDFASFNLVKIDASSTCQLVYEIVSRSGIQLSDALANLLFTGIMYDTGRFSFSNTSRRDFQIAANLLRFDVKPSCIANRLFYNNSLESMKTIGYGLANMQSFLDGGLVVIYLPLDIMQKNNHAQIEELANYSVAIEGVEVGAFVRQVEAGFFKVSFRSKGRINVNQIAKKFGGGGHLHAAGCRFTGNFDDLREKLIEEVAKYL